MVDGRTEEEERQPRFARDLVILSRRGPVADQRVLFAHSSGKLHDPGER